MADDKLYYRHFGNGQAIVILHGLLGSSKNWLSQAKILAKNFSVYCIDLPNHGMSYRTDDMQYQTIATQLNLWLNTHLHEKAIILGHSMGGKVAMKMMDLQPELFLKAIIVDIAPVKYPLHHQTIFSALNKIDLNVLKTRKQADDILKQSIQTASVRNFLLHSLQHSNNQWQWDFDLKHLSNHQQAVANSPNLSTSHAIATLFIKGEQSDYIKESYLPHIYQHFSNVHFKQIANCGHWPHAEKPKVFEHMLGQFIGK